MLTLSTNTIKIKTAARDNYNLADCQIFHIHTSKWKNMEFNEKRTHESIETIWKLTQHLTGAKNKEVPQTKYKILPYTEDTPDMINFRKEIQQLNQEIEEIGCNKWQFQKLHKLRQLLAQEEIDAKWTDLVLNSKADKRVPSLFCQQERRIRSNEQKESKGIKDQSNRIRTDPKGKE